MQPLERRERRGARRHHAPRGAQPPHRLLPRFGRDVPGREVWGDAALYVHPDDGEALAQAVRWLMTHPTERECRANRARTRALTFTPRRMAEAFLEVYAALSVRSHEPWTRVLLHAS